MIHSLKSAMCNAATTAAIVFAVALPLAVLTFCKQEVPVSESESTASGLLEEINQAIQANPGNAENYVRRAEYHRDIANYGDAISDMARAMGLDSVNEAYHLLLADLYLRSARSQFAIGTLERSAMLFPDSLKTLLKLAEVQLIVRQYDQASGTLRKVLTREPQNTEALHLLGLMYQEQGNPERAIQTYQTITELDSEDAEAWTMLGNLLDMKGDPAALQCFENAIKVEPDYPQGWHSKAFYLQNHGEIAQAIAIYKHIHGIDSSYTDAWLNRGILYLEMDSLRSATQCFNQLISLDTTSALGYYFNGVVAQKSGDRSAAIAYFNKALTLEPSSSRIKDAIESLD